MVAATPPEDERPMSEVEARAAEVEDVFVSSDVDAHPDDGIEYDERVELVRTGLIRIHLGGVRYRLRRPFLGELKRLRLSLQDVNDEISEASDEALRIARVLTAETKDDNPETMTPDQWRDWRRDARKRSNEASRVLVDLTEAGRLKWWEETWDLLTLDGRPEDWPSWVLDATLHAALIAHWRSSPLGRG